MLKLLGILNYTSLIILSGTSENLIYLFYA
jgi:hypothetical protein